MLLSADARLLGGADGLGLPLGPDTRAHGELHLATQTHFLAMMLTFALAICPLALVSHAGTVTHMGPEVLSDGQVGKETDVYSFGVLLWQVSGMPPFSLIPPPLTMHQRRIRVEA